MHQYGVRTVIRIEVHMHVPNLEDNANFCNEHTCSFFSHSELLCP